MLLTVTAFALLFGLGVSYGPKLAWRWRLLPDGDLVGDDVRSVPIEPMLSVETPDEWCVSTGLSAVLVTTKSRRERIPLIVNGML